MRSHRPSKTRHQPLWTKQPLMQFRKTYHLKMRRQRAATLPRMDKMEARMQTPIRIKMPKSKMRPQLNKETRNLEAKAPTSSTEAWMA